jgi:uncharacterized damage-inducible protein DinB
MSSISSAAWPSDRRPTALAATPEAIRAYLRFLQRHGEDVDPDAPFDTHIAEHVMEGEFIGNGSSSILFGPDTAPLTEEDIASIVPRFEALNAELVGWLRTQSDDRLNAVPATGGRPAWEIARHVLAARGSYLAAALGSAPGFSRIASAAERGAMPLPAALDESAARVVALVASTTPEQRRLPRLLPSGPRTLRQALRRLLEHDWEHLAELSRRPGGPAL